MVAKTGQLHSESGDKLEKRNPSKEPCSNIKKVKFVEKIQTVIYQGRMKKGKNRKNFEVYSAMEFIAAITQHIPNKFSQLSRYFGFYSNKSRGMRAKTEQIEHAKGTTE